MRIQKIVPIALSLLVMAGVAANGAAVTAQAEENMLLSEETVSLTAENADLFLPESYEQYLELNDPSDVAFSEHYVAVADGSTLYLYDRVAGSYTSYTHTGNVQKVQFSSDETLYFSDDARDMELYSLSPLDLSAGATPTGVHCVSFLISGDTLYTASGAEAQKGFYAYNLTLLPGAVTELQSNVAISGTPSLAFWRGNLLGIPNQTVYEFPAAGGQYRMYQLSQAPEDTLDLSSVAVYRDALYYTARNGLYRYNGGESVTLIWAGEDVHGLTVYDDSLYCVQGKAVLKLAIDGDNVQKAGYEITSASASENRIAQATDSARAGNIVVTADAGNKRVSIYDRTTEEYSTVSCPDPDFAPTAVATDGDLIAVASGDKIYTFHYGEESTGEGRTPDNSGANIVSLACLYGEVYYVTDNNMHGRLGGSSTARGENGTPVSLAANLYGDLFVLYQSGKVFAYTEDTFSIKSVSGTALELTLATPSKLRSDFEGNLYYLDGGALKSFVRAGETGGTVKTLATIRGDSFVYGAGGAAPLSFALGFEDDEVYFLFGNYVVRSEANTLAAIPSLNEMPLGSTKEDTFSAHAADELIVTLPAKSVGIRTSLEELKSTESGFYPFRGYFRTEEEKTGVLLARTEAYLLVAFFEDLEYSVSVFRASEDVTLTSGGFAPAPESKFLTNDVSAYYAPALTNALAAERLPRGSRVSVLGYLDAPDYRYAIVTIEGAEGEQRAQAGYFIPASFLTSVDPAGESSHGYTLGYIKAGSTVTLESGAELVLEERVEARLSKNADGSYTARFAYRGEEYVGSVAASDVYRGESDALRISLMVCLGVLALVIVGLYVWFFPRKK